MDNRPVRLNKFLAERLGVSRREADDLITAGKITVDGQTAILGNKIDSKSKIFYNNKIVPHQAEYLYLAFNKPVGYVCSRRAQGKAPTLYDLLPAKYHHLKTVGRLDKDSSGLILLTNDGDFAYQMTHPKFRKNKIYEVELGKPLEPLHQQMISDFGVLLDDGPSKFTVVRNETAQQNRYIVTLSEGRNRQIRRTFAALGYKVIKLHRIKFGPFELNELPPGKFCVIIEP
ncbi:rRNA pseudouridine synthase [Candidatus Saccharibacteria bacterium]|nr:rRNA pseudouridine synthase [Candidatus Saccharibacteria bacterium]